VNANRILLGTTAQPGANDGELHRAAHKAIWEANQIVFEALPTVIAQIVKNDTWRSFGHDSFASYVLDATTNGLGVNTNQRLWILRCSMDVYGDHVAEWAEVLAKVEEMVRVQSAADGVKLNGSQSLEMLAKDSSDTRMLSGRITYLPSRQTGNDGHLMRFRKNDSGAFRRVISRQSSVTTVLREKRAKNVRQNDVLAYLRYQWNRATEEEQENFLSWLREQGDL
jgi:hypothetical protein